ncbi:hypothetical protein BGX28_008679 [Mortierella sp. GBA30]|nr:hypothetical protein BGX28_008679 [Mortierella sp. GBA30]
MNPAITEQLSEPVTSPLPSVHPLLEIPEVLERILWFLDLDDRRSARLVSKYWCRASRHLFYMKAVWYADSFHSDQASTLRGLSNVDWLVFILNKKKRGNYKFHQAWNSLKDRVLHGHVKTLKCLEVKGRTDRLIHFEAWIKPLILSMCSLSTVIFSEVDPNSYTVASILNICPQLEKLDIRFGCRSSKHENLPLRAGASELTGPYKLNFLRIYHLYCRQNSIEALVASFPALETLVLKHTSDYLEGDLEHHGLSMDGAPTLSINDDGPISRVDIRMLIIHIATSCPKLSSLHVTAFEDEVSMIEPLSLFTNLHTLGVPVGTLSPPLLSVLDAYPRALTSLRLDSDGVSLETNTVELSRHLHKYLCSAPQLQELRLPSMGFDYRLLDLSGDTPAFSREIWACRDLLSLSIRFDDKLLPTEAPSRATVQARNRKLYGYIATVCPKLEHLTILKWTIDCRLEGGLCLLSTLDRLKTLDLCSAELHYHMNLPDLDWINSYLTKPNPKGGVRRSSEHMLPEVLRARYEWLGYKDSRFVDVERLTVLGLTYSPIPELAIINHQRDDTSDSATAAQVAEPDQRHQTCVSLRTLIFSYRDRKRIRYAKPRTMLPSRVWPCLTHLSVHQKPSHETHADEIRHYVRLLRPEVSTNPLNRYDGELQELNEISKTR